MTSLPYDFDTASIWQLIAKLSIGFTMAMIASLLGALAVGKFVAALQLLLILAIAAFFAWKVRSFPMGAIGTITSTTVVTRGVKALGVALRVPSGTFRIDEFASIRYEERLAIIRSGPMQLMGKVTLVGKGKTPAVEVFYGEPELGTTLAHDLSEMLHLELIQAAIPTIRL